MVRRAFGSRELTRRFWGDGTVQVVVNLLPDEAERVLTAVETMRDAMRDEAPAMPPGHADGFLRLVEVGDQEATVAEGSVSAEGRVSAEALCRGGAILRTETGAARSPQRRKVSGGDTQRVVLHLAPHLLSEGLVANLDDGTWVAPETWRRVDCDCALDLVKVDEKGAVLDVGRRPRTDCCFGRLKATLTGRRVARPGGRLQERPPLPPSPESGSCAEASTSRGRGG